MFKKLNKSGTTVILVTHDEEIARFTNRIITLRDGKITDKLAASISQDSTHSEIEKVYIELMRKYSISEKLAMVREITYACQQMALIGIKQRYPEADEKETRLRLGALWLKKEIMRKVFHWNVDEKGL